MFFFLLLVALAPICSNLIKNERRQVNDVEYRDDIKIKEDEIGMHSTVI